MTRFLGWPARGRRDRQADLSDLLKPPLDCADEVALLDGRPRCCLVANGSGVHGRRVLRGAATMTVTDRRFTSAWRVSGRVRNGCGTGEDFS